MRAIAGAVESLERSVEEQVREIKRESDLTTSITASHFPLQNAKLQSLMSEQGRRGADAFQQQGLTKELQSIKALLLGK